MVSFVVKMKCKNMSSSSKLTIHFIFITINLHLNTISTKDTQNKNTEKKMLPFFDKKTSSVAGNQADHRTTTHTRRKTPQISTQNRINNGRPKLDNNRQCKT